MRAEVRISSGIRPAVRAEVEALIHYGLDSVDGIDAAVEVHVTARHPRRFHVLLTEPLPARGHPRCRLVPYVGSVGLAFREPLGLPDPPSGRAVPLRFAAVTDRERRLIDQEAARHGGAVRTWAAPAVEFTGRAWPPGALLAGPPSRARGRSGASRRPRPRVAPGVRHLITLRIPAHPDRVGGYPRTLVYKKSVPVAVADWREHLVALAAHEARHVWQHHTGNPGSEVDAERWALRVLARWRGETH